MSEEGAGQRENRATEIQQVAVVGEAAAAAIEAHHLQTAKRFEPETRHERRLLLCVRDLAVHVAQGEGVADADAFFKEDFQGWVREHVTQAQHYAATFISAYLDAHRDNKSLGHTVGLYLRIWKDWGVEVPANVRAQLQLLESSAWKPNKLRRENQMREVKEVQFEALDAKWEALVKYLSETEPAAFRAQLRSAARAEAPVAASSQSEMLTVANKNDTELREVLVRTRAFVSLLRATGMRGGTAVLLERENFQCTDDGAILVRRMERKSGSVAKVERPVYVCVVPGTDPALDPLIHLAEYLRVARDDPTARRWMFAAGFAPRGADDKSMVSFCTMVQRRYIAVLHAVAMGVGLRDGLGVKKLHAFRVMCTNLLDAKGATAAEREAHIGWRTTTQTKYYSSLKHRALNARTAYLLAGRASRDSPPHAFWALLAKRGVPTDAPGWFDEVHALARAVGLLGGNATDAALRDEMLQIQQSAEDKDPDVLKRRIREMQAEMAELRKRARVDEPQPAPEPTPASVLTAIVSKLRPAAHAPEFPALCRAQLAAVADVLERHGRGSFLLTQSTADGRDLVRVLLLAAITITEGDSAPAGGWLAWVNKHRKSDARLAAVSTQSWAAFKASADVTALT